MPVVKRKDLVGLGCSNGMDKKTFWGGLGTPWHMWVTLIAHLGHPVLGGLRQFIF